jgi:two-component system NtrC family sensor kinase
MTDGARILVVEDSDTQALLLRSALEKDGFAVTRADSAEAALELLNGPLPDLVVADFHLPGMDGRELSRQIRQNSRTRALPVLMLTSAREQDLERQGLESGVDAYVAKSADLDMMLVRLKALLRRGAAPSREGGQQFRRAKLLLVHDSQTTQLRLRHLLEQEGYDVAVTDDAIVAAAQVADGVDCVVLPLTGARLDGFALCRALDRRRQHEAMDFHIVAIGGDGSDVTAAFEAGADEVAPSAVGDDLLRMRIRAVTRRAQVVEETRRAEAEALQRERAMAAAEAKAAAADALARANADLAAANQQLRDAQAQLVQSAKMASLGELVAGIAHEINNPLAFILGHHATVERLIGEVLAEQADAPPAGLSKARDRLASMRVGLQRIQSLVLNLRKFSRLDEAERQVLDVPEAIEIVLALLKPKLGDIAVRRDFGGDRTFDGTPALLNQVVMNIVANAADALEGQGEIAVSTLSTDSDYIIQVDDSGPGVPQDVRDRIFEPFFTTKPVGSGTGLGLAIAYSVVRAHGGEIVVEDATLGGARFRIVLPKGARP